MGLLWIEQVALSLRLVGVGHHKVIHAGLGIAGEAGTRIGQFDLDGDLELVEDGGDHVHIESARLGLVIQKLQRRLKGAAYDQFFGLEPEREQQTEQG